jgi:lipoprotein-anchoring transpeptidase ErfK/SrfK
MAEGGEPNGGMALGQMMAVADKMNKLREFVSPEQNLDPWIASKLAIMDDSAAAISDYMMYNPEAQEMPEMGRGGYTVTRSHDRKGKTHKVTGPDGTVKYFGDSNLGQHPKDPERKAAFYARHKKNLAGNPFFRAFARKTWEDGGSTFSGNAWYQDGGYTSVADYARASGRGSSFKDRKELAKSMGISGYKGTEDQNIQLLNMLKSQDQKARYIPADDDNSEFNETADQTAARLSSIQSAYSKLRSNAPKVNETSKSKAVNSQQEPDMSYQQFMSLANRVGPKLVSQKQEEAMRDQNGYLSEIKNTPVAKKSSTVKSAAVSKDPMKEFMTNVVGKNSIDFSNYNKAAETKARNEQTEKDNDAIVMKYMKKKEIPSDARYLQSGMIADKGTNTMHVVQDGKVVKSFPVLTGKNRDGNENMKGVKYLDDNPQGRSTPVGSYMSTYKNSVFGVPGFWQTPIPAFGAEAPLAKDIATHVTYPGDFKRRDALYDQPANKRNASYGCINCKKPDMEYLANTFPQGDTTMVIDSRKGKDAKFLKNTYGVKAYGGVAEGQEMEVTPEEAEMLRQQGYQFEII